MSRSEVASFASVVPTDDGKSSRDAAVVSLGRRLGSVAFSKILRCRFSEPDSCSEALVAGEGALGTFDNPCVPRGAVAGEFLERSPGAAWSRLPAGILGLEPGRSILVCPGKGCECRGEELEWAADLSLPSLGRCIFDIGQHTVVQVNQKYLAVAGRQSYRPLESVSRSSVSPVKRCTDIACKHRLQKIWPNLYAAFGRGLSCHYHNRVMAGCQAGIHACQHSSVTLLV